MTARGYKNIAIKFEQNRGLRHCRLHFKNIWEELKRFYSFWLWLNKQTGLGRSPNGGIVASDEFWKKHTKGHAAWRKLKYGPPENLSELEIMFEHTAVDGSTSCVPGEHMDDEGDVAEEGGEEDADGSPLSVSNNKRSSNSTARVNSPKKRIKSPMMNCSSDDSLEYSSSDVEDDTVNFARQTLKRHAAVACMIGMYYEVTFLQDKKRSVHTEEGDSGYDWTIRTLKDPIECYNMFIMSRELFYELHDLLRSKYGLKSSEKMCTLESLAMFLWMVGAPQSFRQAKNRFRRSLETVSRRFDDVLESVYRLSIDIIKVKDPTYSTIHPKLQEARFSPHFDNCIGAIDGTHIPVQVPAANVLQYVGRHGYSSQNVLAICDFDMRFTFVVAGWPGSVRDMRVFNDGLNKYGDKFPHPPLGKFYLVDSGYPNRKGFLAPYKGTKYHLPEFRQGPRLAKNYSITTIHLFAMSLRGLLEF